MGNKTISEETRGHTHRIHSLGSIITQTTDHLLPSTGSVLRITHRHISIVFLQPVGPDPRATSSRATVTLTILPPERTPTFLSSLRETNAVIVLWRRKQAHQLESVAGPSSSGVAVTAPACGTGYPRASEVPSGKLCGEPAARWRQGKRC